MKKLSYLFLLMFSAMGLLSSCSTEIDINGDKKEVAVIYSILDATSKVQYVKINRAFLGEGNALEFAQIPDSTLFPYLLDVKLEAISNGVVVKQYPSDTIHINKEGDVFFSGEQPYYYFVINDYYQIIGGDTTYLNPDYTYKLTVTDPVKGNVYEAETPIIKFFSISQPSPYSTSISFALDQSKIVEWNSAKNGKLYEVKYIFTYYEIYNSNLLDTIVKTNEWVLGSAQSNQLDGNEDLAVSYNNYDFYYLLQSRLEARPDVQRYPGYVELVITVAADELNTYIDVNQPSNSIIQERPVFSNISNGIGLFSSKYIRRYSFKLNLNSTDMLRYSTFTQELNFNDYFPNFD